MTVVLLYGKCLPNVTYHCGSYSAFASSSALIPEPREGGRRVTDMSHLGLSPHQSPFSGLLNCHLLQEAYLVNVEGNTNLWWKNKPPGII